MEEVEWVPYTKSGGPMPQMELYIVDILSKRQVRVDPGEGLDQKLYQAAWRPDGSELLFYRIDREHKKLDLMAADPVTGQTRVILSEGQDTFVTSFVLHAKDPDAQFLTLLKDDRRLIWRSERDGWAHLYLYDLQGNLLRRLTQGSFPVVRVVTVDEKAGWVYFTAHPAERPYDTHLYRVDIEGKGFARLTEGEGQHQVHFSPSQAFFLDTHFSLARPPATELRRADGELLQTLSVADVGALEALKWQPPEEFVVKAADGETDLYGVLYKPFDFDPSKQYPLIDSIYGGPQEARAAQAPYAFIADPPVSTYVEMAQCLAQLGFIVVMLDARGTPERGKAFQDVVYGNFGRNEIPDHVAALQQLAQERPYIDAKRVGVFGGSWGGYFTLRAMLLAPEFYKVGIATYPVADLYDHQFGAIEPYMGLPQNNREGYEYASSLRLADQLEGKLLIIHGTGDLNATFSATMKMVEALTRARKPYDLIVLPEQDHHFTGMSKQYWRDSTRRYFVEHLKP
jgi:dipeptidyl aminopeptidase/acylaminoacyl peptidase